MRSNSEYHQPPAPNYLRDTTFSQKFFTAYHHPKAGVISTEVEQIGLCLENKNFHSAGRHLSNLQNNFFPKITDEELKWLLNTPYKFAEARSKQSVLELLITNDAPPKTLDKFFIVGLSNQYFYTVEDRFMLDKLEDNIQVYKEIINHYPNSNLVHLAAKELNLTALKALARFNADFNHKNETGLTPLTLVMEIFPVRVHKSIVQSVKVILDYLVEKLDPRSQYPRREHPFCIALIQNNFMLASDILSHGITPPIGSEGMIFTISENQLDQKVGFHRIAEEVVALTLKIQNLIPNYDQDIREDILYEGCELYGKSVNIQHFYLYLMSFLEMINQTEIHSDRSFAKLAIAIVNHYSLSDINNLLLEVESYHDWLFEDNKQLFSPDYHQNEAEFLLLLAHPELLENFDLTEASYLTRVITSPYRYVDYDVATIKMTEGGWQTISNWQRIGQLTYAFLNWRFDALQPVNPESGKRLPSLLEEFGFKRIKQSSEDEKTFGACFRITPAKQNMNFLSRRLTAENFLPFNTETRFFLAQGYMMISDPQLGTLLIRNSSLIFGRDNMNHPAFYSSKFFDRPFSDVDLEDFTPILARKINGVNDGRFEAKEYRDQIMSLTEEITGIFDAYNRWKFNTDPATAFRKSKGEITNHDIIGAYNSAGFESLVRNLRAIFETNKNNTTPSAVPSLAFMHRYNPPWNSFPFTQGNSSWLNPEIHHKFPVDDYTLEVMENLALGEYDEDDFIASGLQGFFQVGISNQANLTIVATN